MIPSFARRALTICLFVTTIVAPAHAQDADIKPLPFNGALALSRGSVTALGANSFYLSKGDACKMAVNDWGWQSCDGIDAVTLFLVPGADTVVFEMPNSDGHVTMDDWNSKDRDSAIQSIEADLKDALKAQGEKLKVDVTFQGWRVYPTMNAEKKYLYYATDQVWGGEPNINIKAAVFDRLGYMSFSIVPVSINPSEADIRTMIEATIAHYQAKTGQDYGSWLPGDAVSANGALGVLAALVGVKLGKAAIGGLLVAALLILKKAAFLILLPIAWVAKKLKRKDNGSV
jgi:uncharacterized membrane-anchored protein